MIRQAILLLLLVLFAHKAQTFDQTHPKFSISLVKIRFKKGVGNEEIDQFLQSYGIERRNGYKYAEQKLVRQPSAELTLFASSAAEEVTKWREIVVPIGSETVWVQILSKSPIVFEAKRLDYEPGRGLNANTEQPGTESADPESSLSAAKIDGAEVCVLPFTVSGNPGNLFEQIKEFIFERYKEYDVLQEAEDYPNRRVYEVMGARQLVTPKYWEHLVIDVTVTGRPNGTNEDDVVLSVYGSYATAVHQSRKPDEASYDGNLLQLDYQSQLNQFVKRLGADLSARLNPSNS